MTMMREITSSLSGITHFYCNKSRAGLIIGSKVHFPEPFIAHLELKSRKFMRPQEFGA